MIIFYDLDSTVPGRIWSPNTLKTRITLSYKGIPFRTEWIDYPDIEAVCKKVGGPPTGKKPDGSDLYTIPFIYDESTGKAVSESSVIAQYLDDTYPDTPAVFPKATVSGSSLSTRAAIMLLDDFFMNNIFEYMFPFMFAYNASIFTPRAADFYRKLREPSFGCKLEDLSPVGSEKRAEHWRKVQEGFDKLNGFFLQNSGGEAGAKTGFFLGDVFSYADVVLASHLLWMKVAIHSDEWKAVASWNGGRWGKLLQVTRHHYQPGA